jgi:methylated-DNA-[protein]-cysteine S-methyltransferase
MNDAQPEHLRLDRMATPIGEALIVTDDAGWLRAFDWADREADMSRLLRLHYGSHPLAAGAMPAMLRQTLEQYFAGDLACLRGIAWRTGGTAFQRSVWTALTAIPPGQTLSYGVLAAKLGCPRAVRAVGRANGSNPISIVVPCHRVIGADGSLTGYGGGLHRKLWLLRHEGTTFADVDRMGAVHVYSADRPLSRDAARLPHHA